MATFSVEQIEVFGRGVLKAEGVVIDKENNVHGGGRNGIIYKVTPAGRSPNWSPCRQGRSLMA